MVVDRCYWPILRLVKDGFPLAIEASSYTLEKIQELDPSWIDCLRSCLLNKECEFIGSGYAQLIGPLVPSEINRHNQLIGMNRYEAILGEKPRIALVNEQAYSASLVEHYLEAGYNAIIMEWDNPASEHLEWPNWIRYFPQRVIGAEDHEIQLLWNHTIAFQKFQRYAHGEIQIEEYLDYLNGHCGQGPRCFALYGNDAEIFDFRPGRFKTEPQIYEQSEWERIRYVFDRLKQDPRFLLVLPSETLKQFENRKASPLQLESACALAPVKKQAKYNLTRWAATGRGSIEANTLCWRVYEALLNQGTDNDSEWAALCELWGSDYRTHITTNRWSDYKARLETFCKRVGADHRPRVGRLSFMKNHIVPKHFKLNRDGNLLHVECDTLKLSLNCRRGLAIDSLSFATHEWAKTVGTLQHGYFDDIKWGADFYTGHWVSESPQSPKLTDLVIDEPQIGSDVSDRLVVQARIGTSFGILTKEVIVDAVSGSVTFSYCPDWPFLPEGTNRFGHITLWAPSFDVQDMTIATHLGGKLPQCFRLSGCSIDQARPVSALVSVSQMTPATEGTIIIGDCKRQIQINFDPTLAAVVPLLVYQPIGASFLARVIFSAGETDDTRRKEAPLKPLEYQMTISALTQTGRNRVMHCISDNKS